MKFKVFSLCFLVLTFNLIFGNDIFFSEYIEGTSNNKALEIYNPTESEIDLSQYSIKASNNGTGWGFSDYTGEEDTRYSLPLSGILSAGDVYVLYNSSAGTEISSVGDLGLAYNSNANGSVGSNVLSFNGNDAVGLFKDGVLIDVIGVPDQDVKWAVAGLADATGEHTLIRKPTVLSGNTDWAASAGTNANDSEWIVYDQNTFGFLGAHVAGSSENIPPFAKAGEDKVVGYESIVTLDGSNSSDPDGVIVSYLWSQFSGTSVSLTNPDQSIASFTAPGSDAVLVFILTVTDDSSATATDTVAVSVVDGSSSEIFISEYVEGSSYNKYIELYNASDVAVDLISEGYEIRKAANGGGNFTDNFSDWGSKAVLQPGAVIVLSDMQAAIYTSTDIVMSTQFSVMSFNGNDAFGLFKNGLLVDVIGEPDNDADIIKDMTLRRNETVFVGNPVFDMSEWTQYPKDIIEGLGTHSANPDAPVITNVLLFHDFITSSMEIEITATITPVEGQTIATAKIKYGVGGILNNETDMWQDNGNVWMGNIPAQAAYTELECQVVAWDGADNYGESAVQKILIADANVTELAVIRANKEQYKDQMVTVKGIVTIGSGVIDAKYTKLYLQDQSGKGINLFAYDLITGLDRGDELIVVGEVTEYNNVLEIVNFQYEELSTGNSLPEAQNISLTEANSLDYEGTWVKFDGIITDTTIAGGGTTLTIELGGDTSSVRIWNTTGIDVNSYNIGTSYWFSGVINPYYDNFQLLVGYAEDIQPATGIKDSEILLNTFMLNPAYPNPFNPVTQLIWHLNRAGDYELSAYNVLGQKVSIISKGFGQPGAYSYQWNAGELPTGVYYIQLKSGANVKTQKVLLLK